MHHTLEFLYGLERFGIKLGLDVVTQLLKLLGNPHHQFQSIHIAGTNGKGSVAAFCDSVLRQTGLTVGLYTSPHLIRFNERIQVNGIEITDEELVSLTELIRDKMGKLKPTFFEFTTALAFLYFAQKKVDVAVVETGMGGRLDATNVITPLVSVITNIGKDHMEYLGNSLTEIAAEKAGIIKENVPVVTAASGDALRVIRDVAAKKNAQVIEVKTARKIQQTLEVLSFAIEEKKYTTSLLGDHQLTNAALAYGAITCVRKKFGVSDKNIIDGFKATRWPGRIDILSKEPLTIIDGAHNVDGMRALAAFVKTLSNRKILLLGIAKDKEAEEMVKIIVPLFEQVIVTEGSYKPMDVKQLASIVKTYRPVKSIKDSRKAFEKAKGLQGNEMLLITGSLYLIGDVLSVMKKETIAAQQTF